MVAPPLDRRLKRRSLWMVGSHLGAADALAAGIACPASVASSQALTQGAGRFLDNEAVTLAGLVEPMRPLGRERVEAMQAAGVWRALRFVVVQLRNGAGKVWADWLLLSNAPLHRADAAKLAWCCSWRWKIESDFQLLKSHGHHREAWLQQTGPAIARRLLAAAMACPIVWGLPADKSAEAAEFQTWRVRLSGRQTKRTRPHTAPALLKGRWTLLTMLSVLQDTKLELLQQLAHQFLPQNLLDTG